MTIQELMAKEKLDYVKFEIDRQRNNEKESEYVDINTIPLRLSHMVINENGEKVMKFYPTQNQFWNRMLYQTGKLDELPIVEPIDKFIIAREEAKRKALAVREQQRQAEAEAAHKEALKAEIKEQACQAIEKAIK